MLKTNPLNINLVGRVIYGNGLGSRFGFPTANIACAEIPAEVEDGVYVGRCEIGGKDFRAVVNIGRSPSVVENGVRRVEAHILGFSGDLYGSELALQLVCFLRPEQKFASFDLLRAQILRDRQRVVDGDY